MNLCRAGASRRRHSASSPHASAARSGRTVTIRPSRSVSSEPGSVCPGRRPRCASCSQCARSGDYRPWCSSPGPEKVAGGHGRGFGRSRRCRAAAGRSAGHGRGDQLTALAEAGRSHALLADGTIMTIRPAGPGDYEAVKRLHEAMSPDEPVLPFLQHEPGGRGAMKPAGCAARPARTTGRSSACSAINWPASPATSSSPAFRRRKLPWPLPTACTSAVSPRCCSSTWSRWPAPAGSRPSPPRC